MNETAKLAIVILAAGEGTRMRSALPKVLQPLAGRPLLSYVVATARSLTLDTLLVVYGHGGELVRDAIVDDEIVWVHQPEQLGTGHAVDLAMPGIDADATVLILYGDVPLILPATLDRLVVASQAGLAILSAELPDPSGYGRILRDGAGSVTGIVEHKDADEAQRKIREINTGLLAAPADLLNGWLGRLNRDNTQGEYYLTDVVAMAVKDGIRVKTVQPGEAKEIMGINDKIQLAEAETANRLRQAHRLMQQGATIIDPARVDIRGNVECGKDVVLDVNVVLEGDVKLGDGVKIGPNNVIRNTTIADDTEIEPNCVIEDAEIGPRCMIGPFTRIRPGTKLDERVKLGNFVEVKKSHIAAGSKVNHLSYIGDTTMGSDVNIGAGTIVCNYDGVRKHQTIIGDDVFVGSDVQLVAPVTIGRGATVGAGSTITKDVPEDDLALSRVRQVTVKNWKRPRKADVT